MSKINLVLGIHNHQPVGNFDSVFEEAYQKSYLPFLQVVQKHPNIKITKHFSGILLEWIDKNHPEYIKMLRKCVKDKQIQMMSGGYYEPILPSIPEEDIVGQINKLNDYVIKKTGYQPRGIWLTERVWEPYLPVPIKKAGIDYTVIDDSHFKYAGLNDDQLYGYYVTEHNGQLLNIFPISERMRYLMPFQPPHETIEFLRGLQTEEGDRLVVFADDGEKFGVWPGTFTQCYERKWLDTFFTLLESNLDWINVISFEDALSTLEPVGQIYLPTASYREMMEWALPVNAAKEYDHFHHWLVEQNVSKLQMNFVKGGFWRNFMAKYSEANNLQKRMLLSSNRLKEVSTKQTPLETARDHIYAGQCNCPYWHGVFGGLYLPHLRNAIYANLIQADVEMDKVEFKSKEKTGWVKINETDFNSDGFKEVIVQSDLLVLFFSPKNGGCITELDYKPKNMNLLDTMTRREEAYHQKLLQVHEPAAQEVSDSVASIHDLVMVKEEGLEKFLNYDWYNRASMIDHFLNVDVTLESFYKAKYREQGDFVNQPYTVKIDHTENKTDITFERKGHVWVGPEFVPVLVRKKVTVLPKSSDITINYTVKNLHDTQVNLWFGVEFAASLLAGNAPDRNYIVPGQVLENSYLASIGEVNDINRITLRDEWLKLDVNFEINKKANVWRFPIETISMSEAGFERVYQSSIVFPNWKLTLAPGKQWTVEIKQSIVDL